ncbi:MAG TPA: LPS export ABC transporter periplasmic protein LptC [Spirochaetota bacterium]|nr:LPS export ABC transporter periplasmic protein LptC [Spirochaetota bacterium]HPQ49292.1 LPS export ABC transporter periplasmic protein LptC [Spirochaetota bacterium]
MKKIFLNILLFIILTYCSQPNVEDEIKEYKDISRFSAENYIYVSYKNNKPNMFLSSESVNYDNKTSNFVMDNVISKIDSGYNEYSYILSKKGIYNLENKTTTFFENVKIVVEDRYLLEGTFFRWKGSESVLETNPGTPILIRDKSGLLVSGYDFKLDTNTKRFYITNVSMSLPESDNEGF